jgi:hypothetical protein
MKEMSARRRRRHIEPTDGWSNWFRSSSGPSWRATSRSGRWCSSGSRWPSASETETSERTLYRGADRFEAEGVEDLFDAGKAKRRALPPRIRRTILDLEDEQQVSGEPRMFRGEVWCVVGKMYQK